MRYVRPLGLGSSGGGSVSVSAAAAAAATAEKASVLLFVWVLLYIATGALGPIIVDYLGHRGESGDVLSFFPALAAALGLWMVEPLNRVVERMLGLPLLDKPPSARAFIRLLEPRHK